MLSRQEELKERARLLLEQARRDAAVKASNKNNPNSAANAANKAANISDVSLSDLSCSGRILKESASVVRCLSRVGGLSCPVFEPCLAASSLRVLQHRLTVLEQLMD